MALMSTRRPITKRPPLHGAVAGGLTDTVRELLHHGADVNARIDNESTALHWAAQQGHTDTVRVLLKHGADVNARANYKETALDLAAQEGHTEIVQLLKQQAQRTLSITNG